MVMLDQTTSINTYADPTELQTETAERNTLNRIWQFIRDECTFFRLHLFAFTILPLAVSGIFYASNGHHHVKYIDSLFLCYSAMTVTGLSTVNLSTITAWQQIILYLLMMMGDVTVVSWLMVLARKYWFRTHCEYVVAKAKKQRHPVIHRSRSDSMRSISEPIQSRANAILFPNREKPNVQIDVIHPTPSVSVDNGLHTAVSREDPDPAPILTEADVGTFSSSPQEANLSLPHVDSPLLEFPHEPPTSASFPRHITIQDGVPYMRKRPTLLVNDKSNINIPGTPNTKKNNKYEGFGGFPSLPQLTERLAKRMAPAAYRNLQRKFTLPTTTTLEEKSVPWLNFGGLVVGRNSNFHTESLSDEQLEDLGGAEYRALRLLSYLIPVYFVGTQLVAFILFAPWISTTKTFDPVFQAQPSLVNKTWFSLFQVMGGYTGGGLSLVDLGMVPFQTAYLMIFALIFVILAGNHALPIFLRLFIWIGYKSTHERSDTHQALSFLLEHPRRCFLYLFPSHQTWFLVISLVGFSAIEWICFGILDIGLDAFNSIPVGTRILAGLFQGLAARASGFAIVPLASFAPALQFLYVVMMYIAVYPVALSIRTTNVYEERSLGVFEAPPDDEDEEPTDLNHLKGRERIGRYLGWHLRRQMSIDIWWLVCGVFLVAVIERNSLLDEDKKWFDLFRVLFELVSAFGGIGLSLGFPNDNFSFVGAMRPLSKLVVIVIMVRGRHRGLPVAVDRAVLLPSDMVVKQDADKTANTRVSLPNTYENGA